MLYLFISFILAVISYPIFIRYMQKTHYHQVISEYSLAEFKAKSKTPTLGGLIFILATFGSLLILNYRQLAEPKLAAVLLVFFGYGILGLIDDSLILLRQSNIGLKAGRKFIANLVLGVVFYLIYQSQSSTILTLPFGLAQLDLKYFYSVLAVLMLVSASNAVNLTDGMDGLAGGTVLIALIPFALVAYLLQETAIFNFILALSGSLIGYLIFNFKPAKVIMGDVGSLALGASLAAVALVLKQELLLILTGGIFVLETLSVILQIGSVKLRGKRIFPFTPIHYSFKIWGYQERAIVLGFWLVGLFLALISCGVVLG